MSRLWDRCIAEGVKTGGLAGQAGMALLQRHVPVYDITNVVQLYQEQRDQYGELDDFPMVAPPHESYWMEFRWLLGRDLDHRINAPARVGLVFVEIEGDRGWDGPGATALIVSAIGYWHGKPESLGQWKLIIDSAQGLSLVDPSPAGGIRRWHSRRVKGDMETVDTEIATLKELKDRIRSSDQDGIAELLADIDTTRAELEEQRDGALERLEGIEAELDKVLMRVMEAEVLYPALLTHSLLNCRNVEVETNTPSEKLSKRHQRKKGRPLVTFKTLKVNPMGGRRSSGGGGERIDLGGGHVALHIVRGHFKTYTADRPLLGRHVGTYWWSANVRGSAENGIVVKDYEVEM